MSFKFSLRAAKSTPRGSALVMVLLVVLVLTVVGLGVSYFSNVEDKVSGNAKLEKAGQYAAEAGLRAGEAAVNAAAAANIAFTSLYTKADKNTYPNDAFLPPGGGNYAAPLVVGPTSYKDVDIVMPSLAATNQASYTVYIRNNAEDPGGPLTETEAPVRCNLISVGRVNVPGGQGLVKVLEEELIFAARGSQTGTQKGGNAGGTGAGVR